MKAVQFSKYGGSEVLELVDIAKPTPSPGQVLVKVEYAGVNFVDTYVRTGLYPVPHFPMTSGREACGTIEEIGSAVPAAYGLAVGERIAVFASCAFAEYLVCDAATVLKLPSDMSARDGAALVLQGLTAWTLVRDAHEVKAGETVLVRAAAGGTGGLVVQMCKALGATVIGITSTPEKVKLAEEYGCDHVLSYREVADVDAAVLALTDGLGCHAVLSSVGKDTLASDLKLTRRKGTFVTFGNSSGPIESVRPLDLSKKNIKLVRPTLANYITTREEFEMRSNELLDLVAKGHLKLTIGAEYSLAEVGKAQDDLTSGKTMGKLVIKVQ
ncbi:MAG: hypothetical protein STHCBS139747_005334 [Sporothrix thermara]